MTILLMVQGPGDWRPRFRRRFKEDSEKARAHLRAVSSWPYWRCWLVAAENPDDARTIIMQERVFPPEIKSTLGKVLAHGGREKGRTE